MNSSDIVYGIAGILGIALGMGLLISKDFAWRLWNLFKNPSEGEATSTPAWERRRLLSGIVLVLLGTIELVLVAR